MIGSKFALNLAREDSSKGQPLTGPKNLNVEIVDFLASSVILEIVDLTYA
jgi:hypothetical protein